MIYILDMPYCSHTIVMGQIFHIPSYDCDEEHRMADLSLTGGTLLCP